jgi:hypothetical protein
MTSLLVAGWSLCERCRVYMTSQKLSVIQAGKVYTFSTSAPTLSLGSCFPTDRFLASSAVKRYFMRISPKKG